MALERNDSDTGGKYRYLGLTATTVASILLPGVLRLWRCLAWHSLMSLDVGACGEDAKNLFSWHLSILVVGWSTFKFELG